jgi:hypothetical protein
MKQKKLLKTSFLKNATLLAMLRYMNTIYCVHFAVREAEKRRNVDIASGESIIYVRCVIC